MAVEAHREALTRCRSLAFSTSNLEDNVLLPSHLERIVSGAAAVSLDSESLTRC